MYERVEWVDVDSYGGETSRKSPGKSMNQVPGGDVVLVDWRAWKAAHAAAGRPSKSEVSQVRNAHTFHGADSARAMPTLNQRETVTHTRGA